MAAGDRRVAATLRIFVCLLAVASGFQIPDYDPSMIADSTPNQFRYPPGEVIVIDLGNTNSCVAGYVPGETETMLQFCIPSWVAFTDDGAALVGEAAKNHAGPDPEATIFGFKRLFGLRRDNEYEDIVQRLMERVPCKIGARNVVSPSNQVKAKDGVVKQLEVRKIASMVVAELKEKAEEHLGRKVHYAVMTVPQHFTEVSTWEAIGAGEIAGLEIVSTVLEPIAAAVAYGLRGKLREGGNALVLRVGGGTSDASVVTLIDGNFEVFGYWDDPFLGGDDFDQRIVDYFAKLIKTKHGKDISEDRVALGKLRTACEHAKKVLSNQDHAQVSVESLFDGVDFSEPLSRSKFEELNDDMFCKVIALVERAMVGAELERSKNSVDEIVLVGGSTMIPKIQKLVKNYFGGKEPNIMVKPDESIALGAAIIGHSSD
ncbi:luminal-binding protein 5-like [Phragmites australis]|uniref:luminal-binding protein 5-like n=1 Tax=Phragmites australis TaxID=29695 RepID=UPI002D79FA90|nr:luminal-binding protein 5-like [Phragmites australis]